MDLTHCSLFAEFSAAELPVLQALAHQTTLEAGTWAFREKETGEGVIIIGTGTLQITKQSSTGDEEELAVLSSGSYVGEIALFSRGPRTASGLALERVELVTLPYRELRAALDAHPVIAAKFYKAVATEIAHRLQHMNENGVILKSFHRARH